VNDEPVSGKRRDRNRLRNKAMRFEQRASPEFLAASVRRGRAMRAPPDTLEMD
jgi:hypothetical protein